MHSFIPLPLLEEVTQKRREEKRREEKRREKVFERFLGSSVVRRISMATRRLPGYVS